MITIYRNARRTIKNVPDFCGLSSDEKPMEAKNGSTFLEIDTGNIFKFDEEGKNWYEQPQGGGGSGGTTDYTQLENKPSINGITLEGNKTTEELDIIPIVDLGEVSSGFPVRITLNEEQIQTMQKDNCIVSISPEANFKIYFNKITAVRNAIMFVSLNNMSIFYLLVDAIELKGVLDVFRIVQIPSPTGSNDAGKIPVVNSSGNGWVLQTPSGGDVGDLKLVASATLGEAVDIISLDLSQPCTEVIAVLTPYGDSSNPSGNKVPYLYLAGKTAGDTNESISFGGMNLKNDGAMVYDFRAAYWRLEGNLIYKASYKEIGTPPTGIMATSSRPWEIQGNNWEITTIDAFRNLKMQLWGAVFGVGTKLEVYGR